MALDPAPAGKRLGSALLDASTQPADLVSLVRRRRLAHLIAVALLVIAVVALIFSPANSQEDNAATLIGGFSVILLAVAAVVSVQYSVRIHVLRKSKPAPLSPPAVDAEWSPGSTAFAPIQQLQAAAQLLASVLPEIEPVRPGITATADRTRISLENTARRMVLEERMLTTLANGADPDDARAVQTRQNIADLTGRLRSGVEQYVNLTQHATRTATALGDLTGDHDLQDADDQLAGLTQGLQEVQEINADES